MCSLSSLSEGVNPLTADAPQEGLRLCLIDANHEEFTEDIAKAAVVLEKVDSFSFTFWFFDVVQEIDHF